MAYRVSLPDTYAFEVGAAQGGAGILKAIHKETDRRFAVKSYRPPAWLTAREAEAYRGRVRATVERLACVDHPGLAPVFDLVEQDGWVHVLREFVPGVSLAARLTEHGPL